MSLLLAIYLNIETDDEKTNLRFDMTEIDVYVGFQ